MTRALKVGDCVVFDRGSENYRKDSSPRLIKATEKHEGRLFYRLEGVEGLFLRRSIERFMPGEQ